MLNETEQKMLANPNVSMREDRYGYLFYGKEILIILMSNQEAQKWMIETEGRSGIWFSFRGIEDYHDQPQNIYVKDEETWYLLRFSDFVFNQNKIEMIIYALKPVYMATAGLLRYTIEAMTGTPEIKYLFLSVDQEKNRAICKEEL